MKLPPSSAALAITLVISAGLAACAASPAVQYYSLSGAQSSPPTAPSGTPLLLEMAPLAVPERLARPQLVLRQGTQMQVLDLHRWSAAFDRELRDALTSGITSRLGAVDVSSGGRLAGQPVYRVAVQVRQWDAVENSRIDSSMSWTIRRSDDSRNLACQWTQSEAVGPGVPALAQGAQKLAARAAQSLADTLAALDADPAARCPG